MLKKQIEASLSDFPDRIYAINMYYSRHNFHNNRQNQYERKMTPYSPQQTIKIG